ncbi:MAG: ATP-grasp domain-containing protein [Actinomycetota bacterium]|nr:ATP-grasp domain-containing protein [Actinomycetota bacterium]
MRKVLIANRGEIAVRVVRACRDAGLTSVAVYAEPDLDALHVQVADEAFDLGGNTPGESYLDIAKILAAAKKSGADAVHPGYGFLSENQSFAEAVIEAGITWIGPTPDAIARLGDKVEARHIAEAVGAPFVPGTKEPVKDAREVVAFAEEHGLPIAIKAAFGGGGRGMKVAREMSEVEESFASAVREAEQAFGRGECFVERFLDRPRHVEAQILGDTAGTIVVVGDRDCSLQRRYQKLVEEAPAPYLSDEQRQTIHQAAHDIAAKAGYVGAGTVEFLVGEDGTISFLEVNTRLQVEHPVTEEVTGIDLVREQFRIADGQTLDYATPTPRGHAFEFRINGEDPGRNFLPAPGALSLWAPPTGPGVRLDAGVSTGSVIGQAFDSLLAKLIVTGASRQQAAERSRRALAEFQIEGMATALPFHRAVMADPAFVPEGDEPFSVHTTWIENGFDNTIEPFTGATEDAGPPPERERITVEVGGRRLEVVLPGGLGAAGAAGAAGGQRAPRRKSAGRASAAASGDSLTSPMQGTIVKVAVEEGQTVEAGEMVVVLEAMKMEQPLNAHKAGTVSKLTAEVGSTVTSGAVICEISD